MNHLGYAFRRRKMADVSVPENDRMTVIRLTTNQDLNKDVNVRFSITGGADKDEFSI
jgi:hypothetical protein